MLEAEYTKISMLTDENNYQAWAIPIATEQRYYITWGASGDLKFEEMKIVQEEYWEADDMPIELLFDIFQSYEYTISRKYES